MMSSVESFWMSRTVDKFVEHRVPILRAVTERTRPDALDCVITWRIEALTSCIDELYLGTFAVLAYKLGNIGVFLWQSSVFPLVTILRLDTFRLSADTEHAVRLEQVILSFQVSVIVSLLNVRGKEYSLGVLAFENTSARCLDLMERGVLPTEVEKQSVTKGVRLASRVGYYSSGVHDPGLRPRDFSLVKP